MDVIKQIQEGKSAGDILNEKTIEELEAKHAEEIEKKDNIISDLEEQISDRQSSFDNQYEFLLNIKEDNEQFKNIDKLKNKLEELSLSRYEEDWNLIEHFISLLDNVKPEIVYETKIEVPTGFKNDMQTIKSLIDKWEVE